MVRRLVSGCLQRFGYRISNLRHTPRAFLREENLLQVNFDSVVAQHLLSTSDFFFIQVGAFDGVQADPIRKFVLRHKWKGTLVEPQKRAFEMLKQNYAGQPQLSFRNVAISDRNEVRTLYTVTDGEVPAWCQGLASFDRDVILKHREMVPGLAALIETNEVPCITFERLIEDSKADKIDLLQIDAEGYDADLIHMFPFDVVQPAIVHFERKHLSAGALDNCLNRLVEYGYKIANDGAEDLVAYRSGGA